MKTSNLQRSAILGVLMSFAILGNAWAAGLEEKKWSNAYDFIFKNSSEEQTGMLSFDSRGVGLYGEDSNTYIKVGNQSNYGNVVTIGSDNINLSYWGDLELAGGISAGDTISTKVNTTGYQTAVAMNIQATRTGPTQTDSVSSKITTTEITQELDSTYASYGHSLFQMKNGKILMQKDDANGTYGVTVDSNGRRAVLSSENTTSGTSASTSVYSNQIRDEVTNSKTGVTYRVTTTDSGTSFSVSGTSASGYSTTIRGGDTPAKLVAGLPNITGSIFIGCAVPDKWEAGALYSGYDSNPVEGWYSGEDSDNLSLDASRSNSIYGSSDTVQPPAIALLPQVKF